MLFLKLFHLLAVLIWVGGMFFAYVVLRPAAVEILQPPERLRLWNNVFARFFVWVWLSIAVLLLSGFAMIETYGGMAHVGRYVHIMLTLGLGMMAIYGYVYFVRYPMLKKFVAAEQWKEAGATLGKIRELIAINLGLGLFTVVVAMTGLLWG